MSPTQLQKALDELEVTQVDFGRLMGVNPRQARRWIAGDSTIPRSVEIILELWLAGTISADDLQKKKPKK